MNLQDIKVKIPYPLKQAYKYLYRTIPYPLRYGKVFRETSAFLQKSQWWSSEELKEYQFGQLRQLLNHSYSNVPYYRRVFEERGIQPENIQNFDDLRKLPYLTKEIIREHLDELVAVNYHRSQLQHVATGGSTGVPLAVYWEKGVTDPKEWAFIWRQWNWAGFNYGDRRITVRGHIINRFIKGEQQWWEYNPRDNVLILSSYHLTDINLPQYINKIIEFRPVAIQGYPSSLHILAEYLKNNDLRLENVKCVLTSSETLYQNQRRLIEEYFGAKIWDLYGNTERNVLITQCEKGSNHIVSEYGVVELIDENHKIVDKDDIKGEIIATGFNNYAMPFIRYKTGDIGLCSTMMCSCGRNYPVIRNIEGRVQDYFVSRRNSLVPLTGGTDGLVLEEFKHIEKAQFYQEKKGHVILRIVKKPGYTGDDSRHILNVLRKRYGDDLEYHLEFASDIPRTDRGKFRFLIQKLPVEYLSGRSG
jgi:phenylacetate-CoA ligase